MESRELNTQGSLLRSRMRVQNIVAGMVIGVVPMVLAALNLVVQHH